MGPYFILSVEFAPVSRVQAFLNLRIQLFGVQHDDIFHAVQKVESCLKHFGRCLPTPFAQTKLQTTFDLGRERHFHNGSIGLADSIGNDLEFRGSGAVPTVRIEGMTVAGS
jgi:hypothetical protein